jgi:hypothetical protein
MRKFAAAVAAMGLLAAVGLGVAWAKEKKDDFKWLAFATSSQDWQVWLSMEMPSPVEFQTHADCMARVTQFLSSSSNERFKAPYGCIYHGNNYYYVCLVNWLYDGGSFAGCLAKRIASPDDSSSDPLYDPALIGEAESGPTWYCVGWWTDRVLLRSQARARDVAACQHHNSGWEYVPAFMVVKHIAQFTEHCAELGVKINCKGVHPHPGKTKDELDQILEEYTWVQECIDQQ